MSTKGELPKCGLSLSYKQKTSTQKEHLYSWGALFVCKNAQKNNIKIYKMYSYHKEKQFLQYLKQDMQFFNV